MTQVSQQTRLALLMPFASMPPTILGCSAYPGLGPCSLTVELQVEFELLRDGQVRLNNASSVGVTRSRPEDTGTRCPSLYSATRRFMQQQAELLHVHEEPSQVKTDLLARRYSILTACPVFLMQNACSTPKLAVESRRIPWGKGFYPSLR